MLFCKKKKTVYIAIIFLLTAGETGEASTELMVAAVARRFRSRRCGEGREGT